MTPEDIKMHHAANVAAAREAQAMDAMKLLTGLMAFVGKAPSPLAAVASECLNGMLANPQFAVPRENGETYAQACARTAYDLAEALLAEGARREQRNAEAAS